MDARADVPADEELNAMRVQRLARFVRDWSERLRAAIEVSVPAEFRDRYAASLLGDLPQATDDLSTIRAAQSFVQRLEGMASSTVAGAQSAFAMLAGQGLTHPLLCEISALAMVARAETAHLARRYLVRPSSR